MIVRQSACADFCRREAADVPRVHTIMNSFFRPWRFSRGNRGLKVCDSQIDLGAVQFAQRIAPDVIDAQWARYRSAGFLSKSDILARIAHMRLVQDWIYRMRQRLINAASGHHVATEKEAQRHASNLYRPERHYSVSFIQS